METPNPITTLTETEKKTVQETWERVMQDRKGLSEDFFMRFFGENPSYQSLFPSFPDLPVSGIPGNKPLLSHSNNVLYALSGLIDNLDEPEVLLLMLRKNGENHFKRGVTFSMYQTLGPTLRAVLSDRLGPEIMNDYALKCWEKAYAFMLQVFKQGLDAHK